MKTIWFVYPYGPINTEKALECRYVRFGRVLAAKGYNCVWWTANFDHITKTRRTDSWATIDVCENFKIELVPTTVYKKNISFKRAAFELAFAKNLRSRILDLDLPDLIMTSGTGLFTAFRPIWPNMMKRGAPVIYDIMDVHMINAYMKIHYIALTPIVKTITYIIGVLEKPFYEKIAGVCALGKNQLQIAIDKTGKRQLPSCLVYNGIYLDKFREQINKRISVKVPHKNEGWTWCIYAGSLGPSYDITTVINCAKMANSRDSKILFLIAGAGPQMELVKEACEINPCIEYLGILRPEELIPVYSKCDVGLCTYAEYSTVDMPDKFYDYCAAGMAIVNSLHGEVNYYIESNNLGLQYEAGNPDSLYNCLIEIRKPNRLSIYKRNSYAIAEKFDMSNQVIPLVKMIDDITK